MAGGGGAASGPGAAPAHEDREVAATSRDLAAPDKGPITVSTIAEARYFAGGGFRDQIYAVGITPAKLDAVAALNAQGGDVKVITDDLDVAPPSPRIPARSRALVEVDCGEARGGVAP